MVQMPAINTPQFGAYNLWEPLPGDPGAHGDFDDRATGRSPQLWATTHRGLLALAGAGLGLLWALARNSRPAAAISSSG